MMEWLFGVAGMVGGAIAAGVPLYLKLRQGVIAVRREERADEEGEYARIIERLNAEINGRDTRLVALERRYEKVEEDHLKCFEKAAIQDAEIRILRHQVEQLQKLSMNAVVSTTAMVTTDTTGIIVEADDAVRDILGWRPIELKGESVDLIIPRRLRGRHHAGMERARLSGAVRPANIAIQTVALTKDKREIPVIVSLNHHTDDDGNRRISAQIIHRRVFESVEPPHGSDVHVPLGDPTPGTEPRSGSFRPVPHPEPPKENQT